MTTMTINFSAMMKACLKESMQTLLKMKKQKLVSTEPQALPERFENRSIRQCGLNKMELNVPFYLANHIVITYMSPIQMLAMHCSNSNFFSVFVCHMLDFFLLAGGLGTVAAFRRWHNRKMNPWTRQEAAPISLLPFGPLRYLGRGWTFDDRAENTLISQEVQLLRAFFHAFIDDGSTILYQMYIQPPQTSLDSRVHLAEYEIAGFPGAICSSDATRFCWTSCRR